MLQEIKDYLKCAVANKFVLGSYIVAGLSIASIYIGYKTQMPLLIQLPPITFPFIGLIFGTTHFGLDSYKAYKRVQKHIQKYNTIDQRFKNKLSEEYCVQTAIKMAAKEAGLEHLL